VADDLAALGHKLDKLQRVIVGDPKQLKRVGELSQADVEAAVHADIGDLSLSRWFGGNVEIRGWSEVRSDHEVEVGPVPKARGEKREPGTPAFTKSTISITGPGPNPAARSPRGLSVFKRWRMSPMRWEFGPPTTSGSSPRSSGPSSPILTVAAKRLHFITFYPFFM
jgi:hypothetical protein